MIDIIGNKFIYNGIVYPHKKGEIIKVTGWISSYIVMIEFSDGTINECHLCHLRGLSGDSPYLSVISHETETFDKLRKIWNR